MTDAAGVLVLAGWMPQPSTRLRRTTSSTLHRRNGPRTLALSSALCVEDRR